MTLQYRSSDGALIYRSDTGALLAECCCCDYVPLYCATCYVAEYVVTLDGLTNGAAPYNGDHTVTYVSTVGTWIATWKKVLTGWGTLKFIVYYNWGPPKIQVYLDPSGCHGITWQRVDIPNLCDASTGVAFAFTDAWVDLSGCPDDSWGSPTAVVSLP